MTAPSTSPPEREIDRRAPTLPAITNFDEYEASSVAVHISRVQDVLDRAGRELFAAALKSDPKTARIKEQLRDVLERTTTSLASINRSATEVHGSGISSIQFTPPDKSVRIPTWHNNPTVPVERAIELLTNWTHKKLEMLSNAIERPAVIQLCHQLANAVRPIVATENPPALEKAFLERVETGMHANHGLRAVSTLKDLQKAAVPLLSSEKIPQVLKDEITATLEGKNVTPNDQSAEMFIIIKTALDTLGETKKQVEIYKANLERKKIAAAKDFIYGHLSVYFNKHHRVTLPPPDKIIPSGNRYAVPITIDNTTYHLTVQCIKADTQTTAYVLSAPDIASSDRRGAKVDTLAKKLRKQAAPLNSPADIEALTRSILNEIDTQAIVRPTRLSLKNIVGAAALIGISAIIGLGDYFQKKSSPSSTQPTIARITARPNTPRIAHTATPLHARDAGTISSPQTEPPAPLNTIATPTQAPQLVPPPSVYRVVTSEHANVQYFLTQMLTINDLPTPPRLAISTAAHLLGSKHPHGPLASARRIAQMEFQRLANLTEQDRTLEQGERLAAWRGHHRSLHTERGDKFTSRHDGTNYIFEHQDGSGTLLYAITINEETIAQGRRAAWDQEYPGQPYPQHLRPTATPRSAATYSSTTPIIGDHATHTPGLRGYQTSATAMQFSLTPLVAAPLRLSTRISHTHHSQPEMAVRNTQADEQNEALADLRLFEERTRDAKVKAQHQVSRGSGSDTVFRDLASIQIAELGTHLHSPFLARNPLTGKSVENRTDDGRYAPPEEAQALLAQVQKNQSRTRSLLGSIFDAAKRIFA